MMKKYLLLLFASVTIVSCFPTEVWIPVFDNTTATDFIPANKYELVIPFRFDGYTYTKTSRPKEVYQFKCLLTVGDDVTEYGPGEVSWHGIGGMGIHVLMPCYILRFLQIILEA